jgi:predicted kinase
MTVIVFGLPGSGKSYFARRLAGKIGAAYINSDVVRREMPGPRTYSAEEKTAVYDRMIEKARAALRQHRRVVIDGTFYRDALRRRFLDALPPGRVRFIEVLADETLVRERLGRPRKDSEADYAVYNKVKSQWEPLNGDHLALRSTDGNIDALLAAAHEYLLGHDT